MQQITSRWITNEEKCLEETVHRPRPHFLLPTLAPPNVETGSTPLLTDTPVKKEITQNTEQQKQAGKNRKHRSADTTAKPRKRLNFSTSEAHSTPTQSEVEGIKYRVGYQLQSALFVLRWTLLGVMQWISSVDYVWSQMQEVGPQSVCRKGQERQAPCVWILQLGSRGLTYCNMAVCLP